MMAKTTPDTIMLRSRGNEYIKEFGLNGAAIRPGMLVSINASGKVIPNGTAADANAEQVVAVEFDEVGSDIDTNYTVADGAVKCWWPLPGEEAYMLLKTGNNVAVGARLESAGAGNLQAHSTGKHVFTALEAVNNASGSDARIRVRRV